MSDPRSFNAFAEPLPFVAEVWSRATGDYDIAAKLPIYCIVAMPGQLFYSTQIPVSLWFLARNKRSGRGMDGTPLRDRSGETLFIDARKLGYMEDRTRRNLNYARAAVEYGWSRNVLALQIDSALHRRQGQAITNFARTLPDPRSDLAQNLLKDPYNFDFLTLDAAAHERDLERGLLHHLKDFMLELGVGFAFLGSQYHLEVGESESSQPERQGGNRHAYAGRTARRDRGTGA